MPEATAEDLARFRRAVQLRDRCVQAAVADVKRLGFEFGLDDASLTIQARCAYDAMAELIRADERRRPAGPLPEGNTE